jgi:hypothetical protein
MKRKRVFIKILFLLMFLFLTGISFAVASDRILVQKSPGDKSFQATIPDGLYLYKPEIKKDYFSPLFLVKEGKLLDPYTINKNETLKGYTSGKTFDVITGIETIGKLSDVNLEIIEGCQWAEGYAQNINGSGKYTGSPLQEEQYVKGSFYTRNEFLAYTTPKFISGPSDTSKIKGKGLSITEEDRVRVIDAVRRQLMPDAIKKINEDLQLMKENRIVSDDKDSILKVAWAVDLEGNGKKSIIGIYCFSLKLKERDTAASDHSVRTGYVSDILFVLRDNGTIEQVAMSLGFISAFSFINMVDLNGDGFKEIIMECGDIGEDFHGKTIEVYHYSSSGWERVFKSATICDDIKTVIQ